MKCRFLFSVLAVLALAFTISAESAEAGRFRLRRWSGQSRRPVARVNVGRAAPRAPSYMVRQVNGRTLWDLGKQMGQWPSLP